jgi:hypothetical protein
MELSEVPNWLYLRKNSVGEESGISSMASTELNASKAQEKTGNTAGFNFHFITNEKLAHNTRRRYENQVRLIPEYFNMFLG